MKRFVWQWLAASSLLLLARIVAAETRPQYGGKLRIAVRETPMSLDPGDNTQPDSLARRNLLSLIFETLVTVDDRGEVHPELATRWQPETGNQRWRFEIRRGVRFHDGSELTPEMAASALRTANASWKVFAEGDFVIVECDHADSDLPVQLALTHNNIVKRNGGGEFSGKISGTGPFHIEDWQPGKRLTLVAEENHWRGRPFVDTIEIEMGINVHEQLLELDSGKADVVQVAPEQVQRVAMAGHRVSSSQPIELVALAFANEAQTADDKLLRSALAHSIERGSMRSVLLQGTGEASAGLLPNWMSGYGFAFSTNVDAKRARPEREQLRAAPHLTLGYDANDPLARTLVERIALNALDAGLTLRLTAEATADVRLVRITLASADPWGSLGGLAVALGVMVPKTSEDSIEDLYSSEQALVAKQRVIPLLHLPAEWALSPAVRDWRVGADGSWRLEEVWMDKEP
jgi:MarR-like DNA-binding transcriptional regulator SgrR of sgrS sRNA